MQNKKFRFGPLALTNSAANLLNPAAASGGVNAGSSGQYILLRHIRLVNKTNAAHTASLYIGATGGSAGGTEFAWNGASIAANSFLDWYSGDGVRLDTGDFLTGLADANTAVTIEGEGEVGVAG